MSALLERLRAALAPEYHVERELASGGMGMVFLGRDSALDRPVAIKIIRPELWSAQAAERFLREARLLATLNHPNVVSIYQVGERGGFSFCVMEYLEGETLAERLTKGQLPPAEAVQLCRDLLDALEAVHERGVVHRDIKPSNIFRVNGRGILTDFGIAKSLADRSTGLTAPGQTVGTLEYMPPEQAAGREVTPRTDLYALAMVIYEAIAGRPLDRPEVADWSRVPRGVARALRKALAWDPDRRWSDAAAFRRALQAPRRRSYALPAAAVLVAAGVVARALCLPPFHCTKPVYDLVVAPFGAAAADPGVGRDLAFLARDMLERFPAIRVTDDSVATRAAALPSVLFRLGALVTQRGDSLEVQAQVRDSLGQRVHSGTFRRRVSERVDLADDIAFWVIARLRPELKDTYVPDSTLRGRKVAALDEFLRGEAAFQDDAWSDAERHFRAAFELDTTFARAAWRLANAQRWRRISSPVDLPDLLQRKWRYLKPLDSLLIAAEIAPQGPARYRLYEKALARYPDDAYARMLYGAELMHRGPLAGVPLDSAAVVLEEAAAQDPSLTPAHDQLVWALIFLGRRDEARAALDRLQRVRRPPAGPDIDTPAALQVAFVARFEPARFAALFRDAPPGVRQDIARILRVSLGFDSPEAERELGGSVVAAERVAPATRAAGHEAQGLALFALGRLAAALTQFDSAAALFGTPTAGLEALEWRLVPGAIGLPPPAADEAELARTRLATIATGAAPTAARAAWALAVDGYARGKVAVAQTWRSRLRGRADSDDAVGRLDTLLAALELAARGDLPAALTRSAALLPFDESELLGDPFARAVLHAQRAEWLERMGRPAAADRDWLWHENSDFEGWLTGEVEAVEIDWALGTWARWRRARNALAAGEAARGCGYLVRVVELWRDADPAFAADVAKARALRETCPR